MIYLDVLGRCGNQMFQAAFAQALAKIQKDRVSICFSGLNQRYGHYSFDVPSFKNELANFQISHHYITIDEDLKTCIKHYGSLLQRIIFKIYSILRKYYGHIGKDPHVAERQFRNILAAVGIYLDCLYLPKQPFLLTKRKEKNMFIRGYFENPIYFASLASELHDMLTPIEPVANKNTVLLQRIREENSICISFRRWEVVGREICGKDYYQRAIEYMENHVKKPLFVIFSNDVDWVRENFSLPENCIFEDGTDTIPEKIRLMSSCKHFILSNSTFSWWTQFLGEAKDKIVISPRKWYENDNQDCPLIMDSFVTL